jgi:hypothetical protein
MVEEISQECIILESYIPCQDVVEEYYTGTVEAERAMHLREGSNHWFIPILNLELDANLLSC